jgi:hypothetical protein
LAAGDYLGVWKVDRLGRSVLDALSLVQRLDVRGTVLARRHTSTTHQRAEAARLVLDEGKSLGEVAELLRYVRTIIHRAVTKARAARL